MMNIVRCLCYKSGCQIFSSNHIPFWRKRRKGARDTLKKHVGHNWQPSSHSTTFCHNLVLVVVVVVVVHIVVDFLVAGGGSV